MKKLSFYKKIQYLLSEDAKKIPLLIIFVLVVFVSIDTLYQFMNYSSKNGFGKDILGFKKGITLTQSIAVLALVALATTEFFVEYWWALPLAILCFWIRTPLMNMAAPMTSELTMNYVGKGNQEILSAITAAIWSGSWYFSSQIFRFLKSMDMPYAYIFYITAALYAFGVFTYYLLILDYERRVE